MIEGTILGKGVDVRAHALLNEGVAVGDDCSIGAEAVLDPHVKVYPFKTIEAGAAIHTNLIWESRGITTIFGRDGATGLVNVDITAEVAARIGAAYGTTLAKGASVVASRDAHPASRMIKRAIISGLVSTGINVVGPARVAAGGQPARDARRRAHRRPARARRRRRSRHDPGRLLRAARHPRERRHHQGDRALVLAAGVPPHEPRRDRRADVSDAGHEQLRPGAAGRARPRRDRRPRPAPRPELQLLGRLAGHAVARGRPRRRDGRAERLRRFERQPARARHLGCARRDGPARAGGRRRYGRRHRQRGRAGVADRRERGRDPARDDAAPARTRALGVGPAAARCSSRSPRRA